MDRKPRVLRRSITLRTCGCTKTETFGEGNDWKYRVQAVGKIYGAKAKAEKVISDYHQMIEDAKVEMPSLEGTTVLLGIVNSAEGNCKLAVNPDSPHYQLFRDLGMEIPQKVTEDLLPNAFNDLAEVSYEEVKYLDTDYILLGVWGAESKEDGLKILEGIPGMGDLSAVKAGHLQFDESGAFDQAIGQPTALNGK